MTKDYSVIHNIFADTVSKFPNKVSLQIKKDNQLKTLTYKDLEILSLKVATFLIKEGFKKNDFVALILENRPEWATIYLGIMYAGMTCVPLEPQLTSTELRNLIMDSTVKIMFCSYEIFSKKINKDLQEHLTKIVVLDKPEQIFGEGIINFSDDIEGMEPDMTVLPTVLPLDIASLIYTSGTTGQPKGVLLTHRNICSNFKSIVKLNICDPGDNMLSILPLHHAYAFMVTLIVPLFLGAKITYFGLGFRPKELAEVIKETNVTILVGVPQLFSLLYKTIFERIKKIPFFLRPFILPFIRRKVRHNFGRSLRFFVSGGARLEPEIARDLSKLGFKLIEGYGLTETSPVVTLNPPKNLKFGSVGKSIPDVEIRIFNPDKSGIGQVLIKGPNVMKGYFKQPELSAQVIKDGWFYSGDLGYIDKHGYLFLTGREKEVIVLSSGENIYPEELEEYYSQSPYIKEICILEKSEEKFGYPIKLLYAIVIPNLEYFRKTNEADIRGKIRWELENLARSIPSYKHIMGFTNTKEALPRTALKKIKRYQVKLKYLEEKLPKFDIKEVFPLEEDQKILSQDIAKKIIHYISTELKKPVYLDSHLEIDLGIDSLSRVELGLGLETLLSIKIPDELLYSVSTVKEVIIKILEIIAKTQPIIERDGEIPKTWAQILSQQPKGEILKKIRIEVRFLDRLLTWIFKNFFLFIFRIFWSLKIKGRQHLPSQGPYLICPNHASYLDGFVVFSSLTLNCAMNTFFLGYSDIFEHSLVSWAIKLARLIPLDPNTYLTKSMQVVSFVLLHKKIVCIFPEGRRSIDENVGEFKKGVGILIKELDIPVVPVYIKGSHQSWPRGSHLPRFYPLKIIFGQPFSGEELIRKARLESISDDYEAIMQGLREEVLKLA